MRHRECNHDEGASHDCETVNQRNRMIPRAWAEANAATLDAGPTREANVTRAFFEAMNRLCNTPNAPRPEPVNGFNHHRRYVA